MTRRFNDTEAVSGLDLEIPAGSITGVIGPSGSGKTTTIRMMTGSLGPTAGEVQVLGQPANRLPRSARERIGYMPQLFSLYPDLSVSENVDFAASLYGLILWRRWRRKRAVLQLLDLWSVRGRRAGQLSGGMKRRLELAAALVHEPALLILDEPTAGIDPLLRRTVWDELHRLRDGGVTAVVTTQYVTEAEECDHVALISEGRVIAFGTPAEVRKQALGGEVVEVTMTGLYDATTLTRAPGVHDIRQTGPRTFQLVVDDAGTATAETIEQMAAAGGDVESIREFRPTFEDVFASLVRRSRGARSSAESDGEAGDEDASATPDAASATPDAAGADDAPPGEATPPAEDTPPTEGAPSSKDAPPARDAA